MRLEYPEKTQVVIIGSGIIGAAIGAFPELRNFICAAGFSGHGFQHAPATGMIVAELIASGKVEAEDIYPLRPTRFRENNLIHEPITAFRD